MAERAEALVLQMSADIRRMEKALEKIAGDADRQLGRTEKRFDKLNQHIQRSGDQMARDLRAAFATIGVTTAIREVAQYADAWTTASNKLSSAGIAQDKVAATMQDLVNLSQETRQNFSDTVALYSRLTIAGQKLGLTQDQVRRVTELTSKAFVAGGATAQEQAAGIIQLGQSLSSGFLQGDELRSLRENAPLLAQAIADEFKVSIGELKKLGAEGELTSARVAKAILNADGVAEAFSKTVTTLGQAMENLRTEFTRYIAESRIAQTVTAALGGFIQFVTDNIDLLADAAIVAAAAIGGTLAIQAMGRFVSALRTASADAKKAGVAFLSMRTAMMFLGGPAGAVLLGAAAALGTMAFNARTADDVVADLSETLDKYQQTQVEIEDLTGRLTKAQHALNEAIRTQGAVAQDAARLQVNAIGDQLAAQKQLNEQRRLDLREQLRELNRQSNTFSGLSSALEGESKWTMGDWYNQLYRDKLEHPDLPSNASNDRVRTYLNELTRPLTDIEARMSRALSKITEYEAQVADLTQRIQDLDSTLNQGVVGDISIDFPSLPEARAAGQAISGYRTELEKLTDTLKALREARQADADTESQAFMSYDAMLGQDPAADPAAVQAMADKLRAVSEAMDGRELERSREALQALIAFMDSTSVRAAFDQLPSLSDVLLGEDVAIFRSEAEKRVKAAADSIATGIRKLEIDRDAAIATASQAMADALGFDQAGFDAMSASARRALDGAADVYLDAIDQAWQDFQDGVDAMAQTFDFSGPDIPMANAYGTDPVADVLAFNTAQLTAAGIFPSEAQEEFRELMRNSVKQAMREGIRTGDWDEAFRSILADAVTSGLEGALNRVGDWLADFLFAPDGFLGGLINGAGAWLGSNIFGGARAAGGPVSAGKMYLVGEKGPELLRMGGMGGNIINAADTNRMMTGGGGGMIDASITFTGPIDATNLNEVRRMLDHQRAAIMAAMPTAVRGTIIHDRKQKRRY